MNPGGGGGSYKDSAGSAPAGRRFLVCGIRAPQKRTIDPGFRVEGALTVPLNIGLLRYEREQGRNFYRELTAWVDAQPSIESASLVRSAPLGASYA